MMKGGVLSGLRSNPNAAAFGKGRRMQASAGLGLENAKSAQQSSNEQMRQESAQRQQFAANSTAKAGNQTQERIQSAGLRNRANVFDTSLAYDYGALNKRRQLDFQQALLDGLTRSL